MILQLTGFPDGGLMPRRYTCQGDEVSPEVEWLELPNGTESLVLFMYDVSIPMDFLRLTTIDHWVVYNIPPDTNGLSEGVPEEEILKNGAIQGIRWGGKRSYMGPCPLSGTHQYVFELYALNKTLDIEPREATRNKIKDCIKDIVIEKSVYLGKYRKFRLIK